MAPNSFNACTLLPHGVGLGLYAHPLMGLSCMCMVICLRSTHTLTVNDVSRYVDPNQGQRGFAPHRDRQPDDAAATFRADGSAMYATCWVPFTAATPDNSCLYVIPKYVACLASRGCLVEVFPCCSVNA